VEKKTAAAHPAAKPCAGDPVPSDGRGKGRADSRRFRTRRIRRRESGNQIESVSAPWAAAAPLELMSAAHKAHSEAERAGLLLKGIRDCTASAPKRIQSRMPAPI